MIDLPVGIGVGLGFLAAILVHEFVQHQVAFRLGDKTPKLMGRVTLSPQAHFDPLGTAIIPAVFTVAALFANPFYPMFGWGKRHALNPRSLRNPKRDTVIVSLSGPISTGVLAFVTSVVARSLGASPGGMSALTEIFWSMSVVAVFLTVIELLPIPGRDGGRILGVFLSPNAQMKMDELAQYEVLFLLVIFMFLGGVVNSMTAAACGPLTLLPLCLLPLG